MLISAPPTPKPPYTRHRPLTSADLGGKKGCCFPGPQVSQGRWRQASVGWVPSHCTIAVGTELDPRRDLSLTLKKTTSVGMWGA